MCWVQQSRAGDQDPAYVTEAGAYGWAEMVLLGHGEAPGENRTISSVYIKQHRQQRAKQTTKRLFSMETGMKMLNFPVHSYAKDLGSSCCYYIAIKNSQLKRSWVKRRQWMQLKGTVHRGFFHSNIFTLFTYIIL